MRKIPLKSTFLFLLVAVFFTRPVIAQDTPDPSLKLYTLRCGTVQVSNLNAFSDTDRYTGQEKTLNVGCYLIQHSKGWLLWDTGLPGEIADTPEGVTYGPFHLAVQETLIEQLAKLKLKPEDITYVGLSHGHFDHTGGVNLFTDAILIIQRAEYDVLKNNPEEAEYLHMKPESVSYFINNGNSHQVRIIRGDTDIFEDGTVKAISLPGHTPGHMALLVNLPKAGPVILSGDQWHFTENRENNGIPPFNTNRADTLASSDKLNRLIANLGAKLIIQHDLEDNDALPALPDFLE